MGWILLFITIFIIYQLIKPKGPKQLKMTAFDAYLIEQHKASQERANKIPDVIPTVNVTIEQPKAIIEDDEPEINDDTTIKELYLGMIKCNKYDTKGIRKEACEALHVTEAELDIMLKEFKLEKKRK